MDTNQPEKYHEETTADPVAQTYLGPINPVSDTTANTVPGAARLPLDNETTRGYGETISKPAGTIAPVGPVPMLNTEDYLELAQDEDETTAGSGI